MENVMLFEEFVQFNKNSEINEDFEDFLLEHDIIVEGAIQQVLGWTMFPVISLARYLIRTKKKRAIINAELIDMEEGPKKEALKKSLMALTKEEAEMKLKNKKEIELGILKANKVTATLTPEEKQELSDAKEKVQDEIVSLKTELKEID